LGGLGKGQVRWGRQPVTLDQGLERVANGESGTGSQAEDAPQLERGGIGSCELEQSFGFQSSQLHVQEVSLEWGRCPLVGTGTQQLILPTRGIDDLVEQRQVANRDGQLPISG